MVSRNSTLPSWSCLLSLRLILTLIAWFNILFTGLYPEASADGVVKVIAYWNRVYGYAILLITDEYPSFSL